jgi:hypothetical protein
LNFDQTCVRGLILGGQKRLVIALKQGFIDVLVAIMDGLTHVFQKPRLAVASNFLDCNLNRTLQIKTLFLKDEIE